MNTSMALTPARRYESLFYTFISIAALIFLDLVLLPQFVGFSVATTLLYQVLTMLTADENALLQLIGTIAATVKIIVLPVTVLSAISFYRAWQRAETASTLQ